MNAADLEDTRPYTHFPLKHRIIAWVSMHLFDSATYTVSHGLLKGMKRRGGLGWVPAALTSHALTPEETFWANLKLDGLTVFDVGAFHGLLSLFFATRSKRVVSFEPNSKNRQRLMENLKLNNIQNVTVRPVGLGS